MRTIFVFLLIALGTDAYGQQRKHNSSDQLYSLNWDVIGSVKFEITAKKELFPIFSESIKRFENEAFDLKGYIIPIKTGQKQQTFLLATLPVNQCFFCGQNGIPVMVMINMNEPLDYSEKPIHVKGILKLEQKNSSYAPPITIINAKIIL
jgi:hypothetical protein